MTLVESQENKIQQHLITKIRAIFRRQCQIKPNSNQIWHVERLDSSHKVIGKNLHHISSFHYPNWGHTTKGIWSSFAQTVVHCVAIRLPIDVQLVKKLHTVHQNAKNLTGKPINPNVVLTNWLQIQKGKDFMCSFRT